MNDYQTGGVSELKTCAKLLSLGYEVYRGIIQSPIDILIRSKDNQFVKIEVKKIVCKGKNTKYIRTSRAKTRVCNTTYKNDEVDFFVGVHEDSFYVVPYELALRNTKYGFTVSRENLERWDLLPEPFSYIEDKKNDLQIVFPYLSENFLK